jgi:hypothetical protein
MVDMVMAAEVAETNDMATGVATLDWCSDDVASLLDVELTWISPADVVLMWQQ